MILSHVKRVSLTRQNFPYGLRPTVLGTEQTVGLCKSPNFGAGATATKSLRLTKNGLSAPFFSCISKSASWLLILFQFESSIQVEWMSFEQVVSDGMQHETGG